jgi:hypothetical protein
VLHLSRFQPDPLRRTEFLAVVWQGEIPASLELRSYFYTSTRPRGMILVWEGDGEAEAYMDRVWGGHGQWHTDVVSDETASLLTVLDRDLDGFGRILGEHGWDTEQIADALEIRRIGLRAGSPQDAIDAAREFARTHAPPQQM